MMIRSRRSLNCLPSKICLCQISLIQTSISFLSGEASGPSQPRLWYPSSTSAGQASSFNQSMSAVCSVSALCFLQTFCLNTSAVLSANKVFTSLIRFKKKGHLIVADSDTVIEMFHLYHFLWACNKTESFWNVFECRKF